MPLCLYKLYNKEFNLIEFAILNYNQKVTGRQKHFKTIKSNIYKVGINSLANRLYFTNNHVTYEWLNMSLNSFKVHCIVFVWS